jgi:TM2 domain-containing membrane protein YozV
MTSTTDTPFETPAAAERPAPTFTRPSRHDVYVDDPRRKSMLLASVLSAMPGLGQIYVGYYQQGFTNILVICGLFGLAALGVFGGNLEPVAAIFGVFFWFYNIVDAGRRANLYNQALAGLRPMDLPENSKAPGLRGSLGGGLALTIAGVVLFAHTKFEVPLDWLRDWWPLGLVGVGLWLIWEHRKATANPAGEP